MVSQEEWDSIQETLRIVQNKELSDKVLRGMAQVRLGDSRTCNKGVGNVTHFY